MTAATQGAVDLQGHPLNDVKYKPVTNGMSNGHAQGQNGMAETPVVSANGVRSDYVQSDGSSIPPDSSRPSGIICGPLLNYKRMSQSGTGSLSWHGSILIVTKPGDRQYTDLFLSCVGRVQGSTTTNGYENNKTTTQQVRGSRLYEDEEKYFWRFLIEVPLQESEMTWRYSFHPNDGSTHAGAAGRGKWTFCVPAADQSMRIMFHSCNGFSVGTDEEAWSGPALWNDVLRVHSQKPFHVMIGGGDQIYNDGVRVSGPLNKWTAIGNPKKRRAFPFAEQLRDECDKYYYDNYIRWFSTEPFASANGSIPQVNIWDDHGKHRYSVVQ